MRCYLSITMKSFHKKEMKQKILPQREKQNVEFTSKVVMAISSTKTSTFFQGLLFDLLNVSYDFLIILRSRVK